MSVTPMNAFHRRNDSGELIVFEATRYFSGADESSSAVYPHNSTREGGGRAAAARMSLDMAAMMREKKKQPSSPGGRLASFLNSLSNLKKKMKSKTISDDINDHDRASETASDAKTSTRSSEKYLKSFSDKQAVAYLRRNGENVAVKNGSFRNPTTIWKADDDDGADADSDSGSDSSSDLFDLPNVGYCSSGLPVYGTTDMGRIRVEAPISGPYF